MARKALLGGIAALALTGGASAQAATNAAPARFSPGPASASLTKLVTASGGSAAGAAGASYAYLRKLDSHLQVLAAARMSGRSVSAGANAEGVSMSPLGGVHVDVYVNGSLTAAAAALRALGMRVVAVNATQPERMVEGYLPPESLTKAAGLAGVRALLSIPSEDVNAGTVLSQGDAAHHAPAVRALGFNGAGVPVGVISNSINQVAPGVAGSQSTGNLPPQVGGHGVHVLADGDSQSDDEGRAMAEIIYDEAPGISDLFFSTGEGTAARVASINALVASGVKVIADDTFSISEPFFQDGAVATAVDNAKARGVAYVVSAGNRARQSWEGNFKPAGSRNDFNPGSAVDTVQTLGTFSGTQADPRFVFVALQWDEPFGHAKTDLAIDVYSINAAGVPTLAFPEDNTDNIATGIPEEYQSIKLVGQATIGIAIHRVSGKRKPFMKYIVGGTPPFTIGEYATNSGAIDPDAASARGALTVAAAEFDTPSTPEPFSSRGPVRRLFDAAGKRLAVPDVRLKPNVAAADGVATSVAGFDQFYGTSAAAPTAAGLVTLLRSARPSLPVDEIYAIMSQPANSIDCGPTPGPDLDCGGGFILADRALAQALDQSPPFVFGAISPAAPNGKLGFYIPPTTIKWAYADPGSPIGLTSGCLTKPPRDGVSTITCSALSAGGTTSRSVTLKYDGTGPKFKIKGIKSKKKYSRSKLPKKSKIKCKASDKTSGIAKKCKISGYSKKAGKHKLKFKATNGAGITSTKKLTYTVKKH